MGCSRDGCHNVQLAKRLAGSGKPIGSKPRLAILLKDLHILKWGDRFDQYHRTQQGLSPLQGYNAQLTNVEIVLTAFKDGLTQQGFTKR